MSRVYNFTSHNRVYILSCKHTSWPIKARVLSYLLYKSYLFINAYHLFLSYDQFSITLIKIGYIVNDYMPCK